MQASICSSLRFALPPASPRGTRGCQTAALRRPGIAPPAHSVEQNLKGETSNIVAVPSGMELGLSEGQRRKLELQAQAAAALAADNSWWEDEADSPTNLITAATPVAFKRLISEAPDNQLVVVDYLKPSCAGCSRLYPKVKQIAASNPDVLFIKVNVESDAMRELGEGMQVAHLPWFHLFRSAELVASFSANVTTVATLRAEIAANKPCVEPDCTIF